MYGIYSSQNTQSWDTSAQTLHTRNQGTRNKQLTWTKLFFSFKIFYILRFNKQLFFLATVWTLSKYVVQNIPKTVKEEKAKKFKQTYRLAFLSGEFRTESHRVYRLNFMRKKTK